MTVLGLLVAIPQILKLWFGQNPQYGTQGIVPNGDHAYNPFGTVFVSRDDLATIGVTLLAVVALTLLFRYTALGLRMRAVVESPRMTELAGIDADRVSMASWVLCSILAGLAGVLLAPLFAAVSELNYTTLVVVAMSAAVLAALTSIPVAFAGGLLLGVLGEVVDAYLPDEQRAREQPAARAAVPRAVPRADPLALAAQPAPDRRSAGGRRSAAPAARRVAA